MKEKKNILMMLFSIAFLVLSFSVISAFFDAFTLFRMTHGRYRLIAPLFELFTSILGIAFCTFYVLEFFMNKREWLTKAQYVSVIVVLAFFAVTSIVSRLTLGNYNLTQFIALFNVSLQIILSEMMVFITSFFIKRIKRMELEEEQKVQEQQPVEKQAQEQQPLEQEETI